MAYKMKKKILLALEIILYLVGIGLLIQVFFVTGSVSNAFDREAGKKLIISRSQMLQNTSDYQNWLSNTCDDVCAIQLFYYHIFNITNPEEVLDGEYPQMEELGPFVFNRYESKKDVKFSESGHIVSYKYEYEYVLNEKLSNMSLWNYTSWQNYQSNLTVAPTVSPTLWYGVEEVAETVPYPPIYILNPFMLAAMASCRMSNDGAGGGTICNALGFLNRSQYFLFNETVQKILHTGMRSETNIVCNLNPLCNRTQKYIMDSDVYVSEYTGSARMRHMRELINFYEINQTYAGGIDNVNEEFYGFWEENEYFEGLREPKQWPYDTITTDSVLDAFMMDKYRSVKFVSDGTVDILDLKVPKFIIAPHEYRSAHNHSENEKYYQTNSTYYDCFDGLLNLTTTNGANVLQYSSKPYFLDAPHYISEINNKMGLRKPNRVLDETYFAIDTKLGTVFGTQVAYMVSFGIHPLERAGIFNPFDKISPLIVPQFYVRLQASAPEAAIEQYKQVLALLDTTQQFSVYFGPASAFICCVIALYLSGRRYCHWKRKHNYTLYMDETDAQQKDKYSKYEDLNVGDNFVENNAEEDDESGDHDELYDSLGMGYAERDEPMDFMDNSVDRSMKSEWKNTDSGKSGGGSVRSKLLKKVSSSLSNLSYSTSK